MYFSIFLFHSNWYSTHPPHTFFKFLVMLLLTLSIMGHNYVLRRVVTLRTSVRWMSEEILFPFDSSHTMSSIDSSILDWRAEPIYPPPLSPCSMAVLCGLRHHAICIKSNLMLLVAYLLFSCSICLRVANAQYVAGKPSLRLIN